MNHTEYIGRLTTDGEVSYSQSGTAFYRNSIAVDREFKRDGEPDADFFDFVLFGKGAERFEKWTHKGSKVFLSGRNQNNEYTNKDGQKVRSNRLIVEKFEFLDGKSNTEPKEEKKSDGRPRQSLDDFLNVPDGLVDELPFN